MKNGPRVYALDMILPDHRTCSDDIFVIDLNGARSSCSGQRALYGDDRVREAVVRCVAKAGRGVIQSISQVTSSPQQLKFGADRLRQIAGNRCGWYDASDAFMPVGDPYSRPEEDDSAEFVKNLGFDYRQSLVYWDSASQEFMVESEDGSATPMCCWEPEGVIWPYSWDQRNLPLPEGLPVCNPPVYIPPTSNKLLTHRFAIEAGLEAHTPPSAPAGMWRMGSPEFDDVLKRFGSFELAMLKPLSSMRGFGILPIPGGSLGEILRECGLVVSDDRLRIGTELLMLSLLWGEGQELLAMLQKYIPPRTLSHPQTGRPHASVVRATVVVHPDDEFGRVECVDACQILVAAPRDGPVARNSLMLSVNSMSGYMALSEEDSEEVSNVAEKFVLGIEASARRLLLGDTLAEIVRKEGGLICEDLEASGNLPVGIWNDFSSEITLADVMQSLLRGER